MSALDGKRKTAQGRLDWPDGLKSADSESDRLSTGYRNGKK